MIRYLFMLMACPLMAMAAQPSYYIQGFLPQPTDWQARRYLGIFGSNIFYWGTNLPWMSNMTTVAAGTNVTVQTNFVAGQFVYTVNSGTNGGGGGGGITNETVVLADTNTFVWLSVTNNTNYWHVSADIPVSVLTNLTNFVIYSITNLSNYFYTSVSNLSNYVDQSITNLSNYVNIAASNRVTVAAGSFITVTTNNIGNVMVYTVSTGPDTPTNWTAVISGTNISVTLTTTNNTNFYTVSTMGELNNWALYGTNVLNAFLNSNWWWNAYGFNELTNASQFILSASGLGTNITLYGDGNGTNWTTTTPLGWLNTNTSGGFTRFQNGNGAISGPFLTYASSASNAPAENEFPTAHWVRSLFNNGLILYNSTNECVATNTDEPHIMHLFTNTIPPTDRRHYPTVNVNDYVGSVTSTNRFLTLQGPIYVHAFLERTNGLGNVSLSVHPEFYYSYDTPFGTNWYGDFAAQDQVITTGTNLYEWVITFPTIVSTNATGFAIERRFKVGAVAGSTHPGLVVHVGTNIMTGVNDASHISIAGTGGTGGGGTTTLIVTNIGVLTTNIAYTTNQQLDFTYLYNDYWMTNSMTNNINLCPTNMQGGASVSLSISGAASVYTNYNVYFTWPGGATVTWLSITNGSPTTSITSNKMQFYSFLVRTNTTQTNVIASFKEQP